MKRKSKQINFYKVTIFFVIIFSFIILSLNTISNFLIAKKQKLENQLEEKEKILTIEKEKNVELSSMEYLNKFLSSDLRIRNNIYSLEDKHE